MMKQVLLAAIALLCVFAVLVFGNSLTGLVRGAQSTTSGTSVPRRPIRNGPTDDISAVSLGQNSNLNGYLPFPGSSIYQDISTFPVDALNNGYFHAKYAGSSLDVTQVGPGSDLPYYILNTATDNSVIYLHAVSDYAFATGRYDSENDYTLAPVKAGMQAEGGVDASTCYPADSNDHHLDVIDVATHTLFDIYNARSCNGDMREYNQSVWSLDLPIEGQHPNGRTGGDVAGLPTWSGILGVRAEDFKAGEIKHALRWTLSHNSAAPRGYQALYTSPATHGAGNNQSSGARTSVFGQRYRLRASFDEVNDPRGRRWSAQNRILIRALKIYGTINADNGKDMAIQGTADPYFGDWTPLAQIKGSDFEVVDMGSPIIAAQVRDEGDHGGTAEVIDQSAIYSNALTGKVIENNPGRPTISSFTSSAKTVAIGEPVTFHYVATHATDVFIDNAYGRVQGNSGSITFKPTGTSTYVLTVLGKNGWTVSSPIKVAVTGPTVATPTVTPTPGTYPTAQSVSLSTATLGADVHYTLDGSQPNCSSKRYDSPFKISTATSINVVGCNTGHIPSAATVFAFNIHVPGSTPSVVSKATSGSVTDGAVMTVPMNFIAGDAALVSVAWVNTVGLPTAVTCSTVAGRLVASQADGEKASTKVVATYYIASVRPGQQNCVVSFPSGVYGITSVVEISGTSGVDAYASATVDAYPKMSCGTVQTSGSNRLGYVFGERYYSKVTGSAGYAQLFSSGGVAGAYINLSDAGSHALSLDEGDGGEPATACIGLALKP